uniref:TatD-related deoxyribonuclease n=1 Tax=mine drainage metagenome TaxID=410659 RepID=E6QJW3_9ZZZZ
MLIDSHAHLDSERYAGELDAVLRRAWASGVGGVLAIGIGEGPDEMHHALEICREFAGQAGVPQLWASAGIYPHSTHLADAEALAKLDGLLAEPEVIACGEIGLDYYHDGTPHAVQARAFVNQMEIAARRRRPILIHCRPADGDDQCWVDTLRLLEAHWKPTALGGILHCFSGTLEQAERAMEMGFRISFAGQITYPKAQPLRDAAQRIPLDRLLVETDAPYLAPIPYRGQRNEPCRVALTAAMLAEIKGISVEELGLATTKNFSTLFGLALGV